jgi:chromosome segregation ATPase
MDSKYELATRKTLLLRLAELESLDESMCDHQMRWQLMKDRITELQAQNNNMEEEIYEWEESDERLQARLEAVKQCKQRQILAVNQRTDKWYMDATDVMKALEVSK